ncbi:chromate reductase [Shimia gijangensis]|uniref:Chromate reductase n=1 Tax=Shimia gijangensis TaxID=1470563 RepID=A0A1M6AZW6_9RHOB|nr:NAD(P)H-dependent oxidoreductase [Shimia gijangensis]SHI41977.1 chromate reductase [Shimia gijangensis]
MVNYTLLGLSGSLRQTSANSKLLLEAARLSGGQFVQADLRLPLYDNDIEDAHGLPDEVQKLVRQVSQADAVAISTPEYNSGVSGVLKNALDWISRADVKPWTDKPVVLMSAAAGRSGGARALTMLRSCMVPFRAQVISGPEVAVADCNNQFDESGRLSPRYEKSLAELMKGLASEAAR